MFRFTGPRYAGKHEVLDIFRGSTPERLIDRITLLNVTERHPFIPKLLHEVTVSNSRRIRSASETDKIVKLITVKITYEQLYYNTA